MLKTRVFDFYSRLYTGLPELAKAMGISESQIYRVRQGTRPIGEKFIIGAVKAFPGYKLDDLFYVAPEASHKKQSVISKKQIKPASQPVLNPKDMLTARDVARLLNVHINTVRRWSRGGVLKSYRIGSRGDRRFQREDVERFLKKAERNANLGRKN